MKFIFSLIILAACIACGGGHGHSHDETSSDTTSMQDLKHTKEYASAYICPMHCKGSGSDQPGKCPVCGMDYVVNKDFKSDSDSHEGHDHGDHEGHDHN